MTPPDGQHRSTPAALQSGPSEEVSHIKHELITTLLIGIPTLMIAFALLVLKIVEVSRSK